MHANSFHGAVCKNSVCHAADFNVVAIVAMVHAYMADPIFRKMPRILIPYLVAPRLSILLTVSVVLAYSRMRRMDLILCRQLPFLEPSVNHAALAPYGSFLDWHDWLPATLATYSSIGTYRYMSCIKVGIVSTVISLICHPYKV